MSTFHLRQCRLRLWEPERHRHGMVQIDSSGELSPSLLAGRGIQHAEAAMTMGLEPAHAERVGEGYGRQRCTIWPSG